MSSTLLVGSSVCQLPLLTSGSQVLINETAFTDTLDADFPGIYAQGDLFLGPAPNPLTHPHLQLEKSMVSVPTVRPGDMVFWHCVRTSCRGT